jgi:hypothetical protein
MGNTRHEKIYAVLKGTNISLRLGVGGTLKLNEARLALRDLSY